MQDVTAVRENTSRNSQLFETDYEIQSKPTTPKIEQRRIRPRLPPLRADSTVSPKLTPRNPKSQGYAPPASDRESWWRTTIKVKLKLYSNLCIFIFICVGYTKSWYI
jgi:hypothetical protein